MEFVFKTGSYDGPGLTAQVSRALEVRTELESRAKMPRMWRTIDKLNASERADAEELARRRRRSRVYGVLLLILGVLLLVPGVMAPGEMTLQLIAGCVGVVAGALCLFPRGKRRSNLQRRFESSARELIGKAGDAAGTEVRFTDTGMELGETVVEYAALDSVIATEDIYMFVWDGKVTVLQKRDLDGGDADFDEFLRGKTEVIDAAADER